jgi:hypothetical protein
VSGPYGTETEALLASEGDLHQSLLGV